MTRMNVGIIGLGVGEEHVKAFANHPACEVRAVCDFSADKMAAVHSRYRDFRMADDADQILYDPDIQIVSLATYDQYHAVQILKALGHGKHVFVEKPLCLHRSEMEAIQQLCNDKPHLKLSSNLILRKSPRFIWLKERIQSGALGDIYYMEGDYLYGRIEKITKGWRGQLDFYSVVHGGGVHMIDLMLWLTGKHVEKVYACGNQISTQGSQFRYHDFVASLLQFEGGLVAKMSANFGCVRPHFHGLAVYGTKATFINGPDHGWLYETRDPEIPPKKITEPYPGISKGGLIHNFVDAVIGLSDCEITIKEVFEAMEICFQIEEATRQGEGANKTGLSERIVV